VWLRRGDDAGEAAGGFVEFAAFYRATFADTERCVRVVADRLRRMSPRMRI